MSNEISLDSLLKDHKISQRTYDKTILAKQYIEHKYNLKAVKNNEWNSVLDKINALNITNDQKEMVKQEIYQKETEKYRKQRERMTIKDYESLSIIGRGAFGEVHVCRDKKTDEIVAIKKIKKSVIEYKNQLLHSRNEQMFLSNVKSRWFVELKASFQEDDYLYLVMEYLAGGDLMNLFIKKDILTETEARFYIAEMILAIEEIHKYDCIHRDLKPDNVLIDKNGHLKMSDFGLAKISEKIFERKQQEINEGDYNYNNDLMNFSTAATTAKNDIKHKKNYSCVGTAYYVAPEVLEKKGYGFEIDWWSVGVIFYEMLVGYAPFCSKDTSEVCKKILHWDKYLKIPSKTKISPQAEDFIKKMINKSNVRLGKNGAADIKAHPFFKGFNWENVHLMKAPFIPNLINEYDTTYFERFDVLEPFYPPSLNEPKRKRKDIEYLGYTYKEGDELQKENNAYSTVTAIIETLKLYNNSNSNNNGNSNVSSEQDHSNKTTEDIIREKSDQKTSDKSDLSQANIGKKLQIIPLPSRKIKIDCSRNLSGGKNDRKRTLVNRTIVPNSKTNNTGNTVIYPITVTTTSLSDKRLTTRYSPSPIKVNYLNASFKGKSFITGKGDNASKEKVVFPKTNNHFPLSLKNSNSLKNIKRKNNNENHYFTSVVQQPNGSITTRVNTANNVTFSSSTNANNNKDYNICSSVKYKPKITFLQK